jgi:hypothetical protein
MKKMESLACGKWNETESNEYKRAAKIYDPVLRFLRQLQEENNAESFPQESSKETSQESR